MLPNRRINVTLFRYDPGVDRSPRYESYEVPYQEHMRILCALEYINEDLGVDFAFRHSCGIRRCGTCGVLVNGRPRLACWDAAEDEMVIEPLPFFPIVRDLVVDRSPYYTSVESLNAFFLRADPPAVYPEPLAHSQMKGVTRLQDCLECLLCTSTCPALSEHLERFKGPAAMVKLARCAFDPRVKKDYSKSISRSWGFDCSSCYKCANVCPVDIKVVDYIEGLKKRMYDGGVDFDLRYLKDFADGVREHGIVSGASLYVASKGLRAYAKLGAGLRAALRGKLQLREKTISGVEEVRKIWEAVEQQG